MKFSVKKTKMAESNLEQEVINKAVKKRDEGYVMRKNATMKVSRVFLWIILIFIFLRGIGTIFQQDKEAVVNQLIQEFKTNYGTYTSRNRELMSFAENFAKEYLTYTKGGMDDYKERLDKYVSKTFFNGMLQYFDESASATYVNAYRIEEYSSTQADIYVSADVQYVNLVSQSESYTEEITNRMLTLKVPVYYSDGTYVVESLPQFVSDSIYLDNYSPTEYYGTSIPEGDAIGVKISVENFLNAYLEADESVIEYYLDSSAEQTDFIGLNKRFTLEQIDNINCYQLQDKILCLVEYQVRDSENGAVMLQKINMILRKTGEKYYIVSMDTRIGNLNIESEEN